MSGVGMLAAILLPAAGGSLVPFLKWKSRKGMLFYLELLVCVTSLLVWSLLVHRPKEAFQVAHFAGNLVIKLKLDGLSVVFAGLISLLWPLATLYAFEYMKRKEREKSFFLFYTVTYGVTLGISFAGNLLTLYFFYELLTLVTVPLVMHAMSREAVLAGRKYLYYSLGGAAFAFIGLVFVIVYGNSLDFVYGGVLDMARIGERTDVLLFVYVLAFCGFGVKAALCPFNSWLAAASVAPTPVTALLHAVAVVKSGAFAIIRLTYYSFGTDFLWGTWAQNLVMALTILTIVYGASRAVKETHLKRRLAYSTISNLSYILFGVTLMTPAGLVGALSHLVFHGIMKIVAFFCVGAVMYQTGRSYIYEVDGLGKKMPGVFACFTLAALSLMGVPGLAGFVSKWNLAEAAVGSESILAYLGVGAMLFAALLTAVYMLTVVVWAFFPGKDFAHHALDGVKDPGPMMQVPLVLLVAAIVLLGLRSDLLIRFLEDVAKGLR